ncbi:MAG: lytic transglycosylase domain-containing protein [Firmicutes bacterium]|nr:lytic transglycosylase domain-containing protein [Bacillota bacterium]
MKRLGRLSAAVILIIFLGAVLLLTSRDLWEQFFPVRYVAEINGAVAEHGLDPYLALAVIRVESNFRPRARSSVDARGLMQILPETGRWIAEMKGLGEFDPESLYDPAVNIEFGCWYLNYLLKLFENDEHLTLAAYNAGLGRVRQWLADEAWNGRPETVNMIPYAETRFFVRRVLAVRELYRLIYPDLFASRREEQS